MRPVHALPVAVIALAVALLAGAGTSTAGSVFTVDRLDDASPIPDACTAAANDCSFRGAVEAANNKSGADTIMVPPGTYTLAIANSGENLNQTGDVDILESVTIAGAGAGTTEINGDGIDRVLDIYPQIFFGYVEIRDLEITGGVVTGSAPGGGLRAGSGDVLLEDVDVRNNSSEYRGGGIFQDEYANLTLRNVNVVSNMAVHAIETTLGGGLGKADGIDSSLEITDSLFQGNTADYGGGLHIGVSSVANVLRTTLHSNVATEDCTSCRGGGGGLYLGASEVTFTDGLISGNTALAVGGGVLAGGIIHLSGTTVFDNTAARQGGGLSASSGSTVTDSLFADNTAATQGGGLRIRGVQVTDTTITGNTTAADGGGFWGFSNTITGSTITNNSADRGGGFFDIGATNSLTNTTITGNTAKTVGGGIFKGAPSAVTRAPAGLPPPGETPLSHVTLTSNSAPDGANLANESSGPITLAASIVADPVGSASCSGNIVSSGQNFDEGGSCGLADATDLAGPDALLGPLAENGGPTATHALLAGSPAIDLVTTDCPPPATDQRGNARPNGPACDAGAFEAESTATATATPGPTASPSPTASLGGDDRRTWADNNCSGSVDPVDSLVTLRADAGLSANTGECPEMGEVVDVALASPHPWGDIDCSGAMTPVDSLKILRHDAALGVTQAAGCPGMGADVVISPIFFGAIG